MLSLVEWDSVTQHVAVRRDGCADSASAWGQGSTCEGLGGPGSILRVSVTEQGRQEEKGEQVAGRISWAGLQGFVLHFWGTFKS